MGLLLGQLDQTIAMLADMFSMEKHAPATLGANSCDSTLQHAAYEFLEA